MTTLSKKGLITSTRGRNGGYSVSRKIDSIYLSEIINAIEEIAAQGVDITIFYSPRGKKWYVGIDLKGEGYPYDIRIWNKELIDEFKILIEVEKGPLVKYYGAEL